MQVCAQTLASHDEMYATACQTCRLETPIVFLQAVVCSTAICAMSFNVAAATDKAQLLALGDAEGMLRVAEVCMFC
jgi:hypothetical protein